MGKTKNQTNDSKSEKLVSPSSSNGIEKSNHGKSVGAQLRSIELPKSADGLTAEQLNENQKIVFKRECQKMYGHKYVERRKLPANSIETAAAQLEAKLKEKLKQKKLEKIKQKKKS